MIPKKKICIISCSLGKGGLERFCANLSILLSDNGFDVHLVILNNDIDYDYKGQLLNLGKCKDQDDNIFKRLLRFRKLKKYFRSQKFDYIIDNRIGDLTFRELYYRFYIYGIRSKLVYMQHNHNIESHFPKPSIASRILINRACDIISVSELIATTFNARYKTNKCHCVYNFIPASQQCISNDGVNGEDILFFGRLNDHQKNISFLIEAYNLSEAQYRHKLIILGDGLDLMLLRAKVSTLKLDDRVLFLPFTKDVYSILSNVKFTVLTSRYEGFPMTIVESLSSGIPVISVDCHSGPSEIIKDRINGVLVKEYTPQAFADAMNMLVNDDELYKRCKDNALSSIKHLSGDVIIENWKTVLM